MTAVRKSICARFCSLTCRENRVLPDVMDSQKCYQLVQFPLSAPYYLPYTSTKMSLVNNCVVRFILQLFSLSHSLSIPFFCYFSLFIFLPSLYLSTLSLSLHSLFLLLLFVSFYPLSFYSLSLHSLFLLLLFLSFYPLFLLSLSLIPSF